MPLRLVSHPVIEDSLARLRDRETPCDEFRRLARRVSLLLAAEATKDLALRSAEVETPLERTVVGRIASRVVAVPVLRAGLGMLEAFLELVPEAQVGYFGLERNEETAATRRYYEKVPKDLAGAVVFLLDPMLATGGSVAHLESVVPDAIVYTAALDRELNDRKYILPGLGDFGDRLFGT